MSYSNEQRIEYLNSCLLQLAPWDEVMGRTSTTSVSDAELPRIDTNYFAFFAGMWSHRTKGNESITIAEATRFIELSPSRASRFVGDMIAFGYMEEKADPRDRRKKVLRLSDETYLRITKAVDQSMQAFEKIFSREDA